MKKILLIIFISAFSLSCNKTLKLELPQTNEDSFNFYSYNEAGTFLYFRPFKPIDAASDLILTFTSSKYGKLILVDEVLLPGDQMVLKYKDFKNFRLPISYDTKEKGVDLNFTLKFESITKTTQLKFN